jgi:hypothetical protein
MVLLIKCETWVVVFLIRLIHSLFFYKNFGGGDRGVSIVTQDLIQLDVEDITSSFISFGHFLQNRQYDINT